MTNPLLREALDLRARYDEEPSHSDHVAALARQLFDSLHAWHGRGESARELLHAAALLHDIGWSQTPDGRGHHKFSARLILAHNWKSLTREEAALVAQVARYHRKSIPLAKHAAFHALSRSAQKETMILGGILRVADALDRTHTGRVEKIVSAKVTQDLLLIRVRPDGRWEAEQEMFEVKRNMLELAAERAVRCEAEPPAKK